MTSSTVPRFTVEPQSSVVRTGSSVALTCAVEPQTANIRWTVNGSTISPQAARRRGIELTRGGQLVIAAFNRLSSSSSSSVSATAGRFTHDGVYQCAAVTQAGVIVSSEAKLHTACMFRILYGDRAMHSADYAVARCPSVRSSVCPSVTRRYIVYRNG